MFWIFLVDELWILRYLWPGWVSTVDQRWGWWPETTFPTTASCLTPATWPGLKLFHYFLGVLGDNSLWCRVMEKMGEGMRIHISSISKELLDMVALKPVIITDSSAFTLSRISTSDLFILPQGWGLPMWLQGCSGPWGNMLPVPNYFQHITVQDVTFRWLQHQSIMYNFTEMICIPPRPTEARWKPIGWLDLLLELDQSRRSQ